MNDLRGLHEVLLDRDVAAEEVRQALCVQFGIQPGMIRLVASYDELDNTPAEIVCLFAPLPGGEFMTHLSLDGRLVADAPRIETAVEVCRLLRCRCLVDDGCVNPFTFLCVDGSGRCERISVEPTEAEHERYTISKVIAETDWMLPKKPRIER